MKKLMIFVLLIGVAVFSFADMSIERAIYLEQVLNENGANTRNSYNIENSRVDLDQTRGVNYGFLISLSEDFVNGILKDKIQHEALKELNLYFRNNKYVIDGTLYFEMLDLDIPFTVTGRLLVMGDTKIAMDVEEMKVWSEGNLPTDKILEKVIAFIGKTKDLDEYVNIGYQKVAANRYDSYGRILVEVKLARMAPSLPSLKLMGITPANEKLMVSGK